MVQTYLIHFNNPKKMDSLRIQLNNEICNQADQTKCVGRHFVGPETCEKKYGWNKEY